MTQLQYKKPPYTCAELAKMKLAGYPISKKGWIELVDRENFTKEKRIGRGGGFSYFPPAKIQKEIDRAASFKQDHAATRAIIDLRAKLHAEDEQARAHKTSVSLNTMMASVTVKGQLKFNAKFDILLAWRDFYQFGNSPTAKGEPQKMGRKESFHLFSDAYNAGQISVKPEVKKQYHTMSWRSVERMVLANEKDGLVVITDKRHTKGAKVQSQIESHPELEKSIIAILADKPHIQDGHLTQLINHARIDQGSGEVLWPQISYWAVGRYRKAFMAANAQAMLAVTNPDAWKNKYLSALGSLDGDIQRLNQRWELDGTPADWEFVDGRHTASVVIDLFSRRMKIIFSKSARTETNKLLMRRAILDWGVPETAKTDNGTDYVSREMKLFFNEIGIIDEQSNKFSPWEKGHVERCIQTYLHSVLEMLDNFIGHNVTERQALRAKQTFAENLFTKNAVVKVDMTVEEMQRLTDAWLDGTYHTSIHSALGMSPLAKTATWTGAIKRIENERALDLLLAKPIKKMPTITKKGIAYDKATFIHSLLPLHQGKLADIRLDPNDLGRLVVYVDGKFLCIAECPSRTGMNQQEVAAHGRAKQQEFISQKRKEFRAAKKSLPMTTDELVKDLLISRAEKAGKVTILETYVEKHETRAMQEAELAAQAMEAPKTSPAHALLLAEARQMAAKAMNPNPTIIEHPAQARATPLEGMNVEDKYALWLDFDAAVTKGDVLTEGWQVRFYSGYPKTSAFRAQAQLRKENGL